MWLLPSLSLSPFLPPLTGILLPFLFWLIGSAWTSRAHLTHTPTRQPLTYILTVTHAVAHACSFHVHFCPDALVVGICQNLNSSSLWVLRPLGVQSSQTNHRLTSDTLPSSVVFGPTFREACVDIHESKEAAHQLSLGASGQRSI